MTTEVETAAVTVPEQERGRRKKRRSPQAAATARLAGMLVSPTLLVLGLVVVYPIIASLRQSLFTEGQGVDADGFVVEGEQFAGLANYTDVFTGPVAGLSRNTNPSVAATGGASVGR